ncbi:dispanin subfamily A member 2b-like isoform 1-T2 [Anomaloglossus baeobatrachus]|uniref:dispanin subfamily A member 2b-like n=1 Tax=Anomaloglossus baeobatrachus TaxID=238106 RepID=UPI003F50D465
MASSGQKDYLGWSIFSTLCCCLPIGVAALIFSIKARDAANQNDSTTAAKHSKMAFNLNIAALVLGIIFIMIVIVVTNVNRP